MGKVAKGKGKTRRKNGKTENVLIGKTTDRQTAFKNTICIKAGTYIKHRHA